MTTRLDALVLPLRGSRLIEASAGTGKTWTIASLYLRLVLGHDDEHGFGRPLVPSEILVMTFTRAATRELSDRIRGRLVGAARVFRDPSTIEAGDTLLAALLAACPEGGGRDEAAWRLSMAADAMDDAAIVTIDAWTQRMLREHAFDSGCLFDEEVQPDEEGVLVDAARDYWRQEVYPLRGAALDAVLAVWADVDALTEDLWRMLHKLPAEAGTESLDDVRRRALHERDVALATQKSGWIERVGTMRTWLMGHLESGASPFNGKRLQRGRINDSLDCLAAWARTPEQADPGLSDKASFRLTPAGLRDALKPGCSVDIPPEFDAMADLVARLRDIEQPEHAMRRHAGMRVAARMLDAKRQAGVFGFDDMLERLEAALAGPRGASLRARIVAQYPVALIDEFQDTSLLQYRIFDRLYRTAGNDPDTALLLIGDPKQSIYRFRGADIDSYLRARSAMEGRHYFLGTNYRSTVPLVAAVNRLFEEGETLAAGAFRFGEALPFLPVDARGRPEVLRDRDGPWPALTICHDAEPLSIDALRRRFAEHCAEHIVRSLDDPDAGFDDPVLGFTRLRPDHLAILVRDRNEAAAVRRALGRRRVPSVFLSDQESVFAGPEAADLLHWLRAIAEPLDSRRARVAFATSLAGLTVGQMAELATDDVAFERRLEQLRMLHGEWRRQGVLPMLRRMLHVLELPARWLADDGGERTLTNVLHLAELLQAASAHLDGEQALIRWLAEQVGRQGVRAVEQIVRLESDADLVRITTIHKAKGLEYPVVYLPFACSFRERRNDAGEVLPVTRDDGVRTLRFDLTDDDREQVRLEEKREDVRLLYVALTRARHALWLGVAALAAGKAPACAFARSAFGYLLSEDRDVTAPQIAGRLAAVFGALPQVSLVAASGPAAVTRLTTKAAEAPLADGPAYAGRFERDWSIGSFSALVRDLARMPSSAVMVAPAVEEELRSGPGDEGVAPPSNAARHRFPRGPLPGNFLHDQLEWLATQRFAMRDPRVREQLARRCERLGWGHRVADVETWLREIAETRLPPLGVALERLPRILPEMEFWFPAPGIDAPRIDRACRDRLLGGRERPALPSRALHGMLMGFVDLVFECDGRYWVLDYKSNALGAGDADYDHDAMERSMAAHRYDVQGAIYLLALHRLLARRLGDRYDPARQLGGALYLFLRGIAGPASGCYVVAPDLALLDALDAAIGPPVPEAR